MTTVLLTGAGGFVGHHTLEHLLSETDWHVLATDSFRHRGKTDRIAEVIAAHPEWRERLTLITHDLAAPFTSQTITRMGRVDYVIAMASESHVDRSIEDPVPFVQNNVNVILSTLELCRALEPRHVIVISTDEVYGPEPLSDGLPVPHAEWSPIIPSNPYSASKAAQEAIAVAYWRTFSIPLTIINAMNLIGERQDREKFLPLLIWSVATDTEIGIHGRAGDVGSRHYLHARNLADAIVFLLSNLAPAGFPDDDRPHRFNVVGPDRISNLALGTQVAKLVGKPLKYRLVDFHSARPGHDPHYGLDPSKMTAAGWKPPVPFEESLARTVRWTLDHPEWLL
jgi:dTDP-glucose 4,6-dehydratase